MVSIVTVTAAVVVVLPAASLSLTEMLCRPSPSVPAVSVIEPVVISPCVSTWVTGAPNDDPLLSSSTVSPAVAPLTLMLKSGVLSLVRLSLVLPPGPAVSVAVVRSGAFNVAIVVSIVTVTAAVVVVLPALSVAVAVKL